MTHDEDAVSLCLVLLWKRTSLNRLKAIKSATPLQRRVLMMVAAVMELK